MKKRNGLGVVVAILIGLACAAGGCGDPQEKGSPTGEGGPAPKADVGTSNNPDGSITGDNSRAND